MEIIIVCYLYFLMSEFSMYMMFWFGYEFFIHGYRIDKSAQPNTLMGHKNNYERFIPVFRQNI
ncbi:hypothetical protein IC802_01895 [Geobacillus sp. 44C]|nr:hypothetical protein IC802_01895 [Geobacillus sp. 44C]